jgi:predicted Zn-dependent protease
MSDVFRSQSWAMKVPDSWTVDDSEEAVAFVPRGVDDAALIVSAFYKDSDITMEEMRDFIQSAAHDGILFSGVRLGDFTGYRTSYARRDEEGETAWRAWCVFCRDVFLYITYNCSLRRRGKDDAMVDDMLRTVTCIRAG